jgi:hypothetical protein
VISQDYEIVQEFYDHLVFRHERLSSLGFNEFPREKWSELSGLINHYIPRTIGFKFKKTDDEHLDDSLDLLARAERLIVEADFLHDGRVFYSA